MLLGSNSQPIGLVQKSKVAGLSSNSGMHKLQNYNMIHCLPI